MSVRCERAQEPTGPRRPADRPAPNLGASWLDQLLGGHAVDGYFDPSVRLITLDKRRSARGAGAFRLGDLQVGLAEALSPNPVVRDAIGNELIRDRVGTPLRQILVE